MHRESALKLGKRIYSCLVSIRVETCLYQKFGFFLNNKINNERAESGQYNRIIIKNGGGGRIEGCSFLFRGKHNEIYINKGASITNVSFEMAGQRNRIFIGRNVVLHDSLIAVSDIGSKLIIKDDVSAGDNAKWVVLEGTKVEIGRKCLFSTNSHIRSSDSHSIIEMTDGRRKNLAANIKIGQRVWFGEDVTCMKGAIIGDEAIFGSKSLITKGIYEGNAVYAGIPCKKLKGNVCWKPERIK